MTAWKKHGLDSPSFTEVVKDTLHFLGKAPTATTDFLPHFIRVSEKKAVASAASADSTFWPLLTRARLVMTDVSGNEWDGVLSELIADKLTDCLELKDNFEPQIVKLFECPDALAKAELSGGVLTQVRALELAVKGSTCALECLHAFSRTDLHSAVGVITDKNNTIANCIMLYATGRKIVQRLTLRLESMDRSDAKIEAVIIAVGKLAQVFPEKWETLLEQPEALKEAVNLVNDGLRNLSMPDIKRTDERFMTASSHVINQVFDLYMRFFEWGYHVILAAARDDSKPWPADSVATIIAEVEAPLAGISHLAQFKAICAKMEISMHVSWDALDPARMQMSCLLQKMPDALKVKASLMQDPEKVSREDASLLPRLFYLFEMKFGWAKMVTGAKVCAEDCGGRRRRRDAVPSPPRARSLRTSPPFLPTSPPPAVLGEGVEGSAVATMTSPPARPQDLATLSLTFGKALQQAYYPRAISEAVAKCISNDPTVKTALEEIWDGIPPEFLSNSAPSKAVGPLCPDVVATSNLINSIGDTKLAQQFRVLQDCHSCVDSRAKLKERRGAEGPTFASEDAEAFKAGRSTLAAARTSLARPSLARCFAVIEGATGADAVHLAKFDGLVDPSDLSSACVNVLESELGIWVQKWKASVEKVTADVEGWCPSGWQMYKVQGWELFLVQPFPSLPSLPAPAGREGRDDEPRGRTR